MLKKVVRDRPKDWHRYLPALLFACRELPSESTGFSPFKLLFGRKVRGPVSLLQEVWTDRSQEDEQDKPLYGYIFDLQNRLDEVAKVAMESVAKSSVRGKHYFDRKARDRRFKEDESICDVKFDSQLSLSQRTELENIFSRHSDILTTKPGCFSDDLFLEIPVTTVVPVKRRMYDIPFSAKEIVEREVQTMFEANARAQGFSQEFWPLVLSSHLEGAALSLYHSLADGGEELTYGVLRDNLCKKFRCTEDGYRKRFRESKPGVNESFDIYAVELKRLMDRWIALSEIDKSFDGLVDLFLSEQLMQSVSKDLKTFLCEKNLKSFPEKITAAESYRVAHPEKVLSRKSDGSSVYASVGMQESVEEEEIESAAFSGYYQSDRSRPRFRNFGALDRVQRGGRNVRRGRGFNPNQFREPYNSADFTSYRDTGSYQNRDFRDRRAVDRGQFGSSFGRGAGNQQGVGRGAGNYQRPGGSGSGMFCPLCRKQGHTSITCRFGASNSAAESCSHCGLTHIRGYCVNRPGSYAGMSSYQESEDADCEVGCCSVVLESVQEEAGVKHTVCSSIQEYSGCLKLESGKVNGTVCSVLRDT
ncbi:hypothetical protein ACOMHN_061169 [Nucella lapillus]